MKYYIINQSKSEENWDRSSKKLNFQQFSLGKERWRFEFKFKGSLALSLVRLPEGAIARLNY